MGGVARKAVITNARAKGLALLFWQLVKYFLRFKGVYHLFYCMFKYVLKKGIVLVYFRLKPKKRANIAPLLLRGNVHLAKTRLVNHGPKHIGRRTCIADLVKEETSSATAATQPGELLSSFRKELADTFESFRSFLDKCPVAQPNSRGS